MAGALTVRTARTVADFVIRSSWRSQRPVLLGMWVGVSLLMFPLVAVLAFGTALRAQWQSVGRGALVWTASDSLDAAAPILGVGCHVQASVVPSAGRSIGVWIAPAVLWPAVGWDVAWLPRSRSGSDLLLVPINHYSPFISSLSIHGVLTRSVGQTRPPLGDFVGMPTDAWLLMRDPGAPRAMCGDATGFFRRLDRDPQTMADADPARWQLVHTPGGVAYSEWKSSERIFTGVVLGTVLALLVLAAGAAHFWAAGQARAWAIARLCGTAWPLLRWQVLVETLWIVAPGVLVGGVASRAILIAEMARARLLVPSDLVFAGTPVLVGSSLAVTLAALLWGRMRRLSPVEGLREAREWHG